MQPCTEFEINLDKWYREKTSGVMYRTMQVLVLLFNYGRHAAIGSSYIDIVAERTAGCQFVRQIIIDF